MGPEEREHLVLPHINPTDLEPSELTIKAVNEAFQRVKQQLSTYTVTVTGEETPVEIPQTTTPKFKVRRCSNWK